MIFHNSDFAGRLTVNQSENSDYACTINSQPQKITIHSTTQSLGDFISYNEWKEKEKAMKIEDIKKLFETAKEKYDIDYTNEYVDLYLKTESTLKPFSTIIDSNGDIILNMQNKPKDMEYAWIENKESVSWNDCATVWATCQTNENKIQKYKKILRTLSGDKYNYYKVRVLLSDIKDIKNRFDFKLFSPKINVTKMEIINKIDSIPEITFEITDVKENGDIVVILKNSLTHSASPEFVIKAEYENEIVPAIEKKLDDMHTAVELAKNKGTIYTTNLSSGLQEYISKGE